MVRNKVDTCMFCGEAPCICNVKAPTPKRARTPRAAAAPTSTPTDAPAPVAPPVAPPVAAPPPLRPSMLDAMRATAAAQPTETITIPGKEARKRDNSNNSSDDNLRSAASPRQTLHQSGRRALDVNRRETVGMAQLGQLSPGADSQHIPQQRDWQRDYTPGDTQRLLFDSAIRAFARVGLLGSEDRATYRHIITSNPSLAERAVVWRERRRYSAEQE